jgi:hypothetical protein
MAYEQYLLNSAKEQFATMAEAYAFVKEEYEIYLDGLYPNPDDYLKMYEPNIEWMYQDLYKYYSAKGDKTVYIESIKKNKNAILIGAGILITITVIILIFKRHGKKK